MLERLKERVYRETLKLREYGLAVPTGGSVSGIDREKGLVVIRPGGVSCGELTSADMLVVDLIDGRVAEGKHRPPIDTPTPSLSLPRVSRDRRARTYPFRQRRGMGAGGERPPGLRGDPGGRFLRGRPLYARSYGERSEGHV